MTFVVRRVRLSQPSLAKMCSRWVVTVRTLSTSAAAICGLESPWATPGEHLDLPDRQVVGELARALRDDGALDRAEEPDAGPMDPHLPPPAVPVQPEPPAGQLT
ncbi:hypothetical protein Psi02_65700 [Planotetraspora silvatica]|uniref:Uncharacterized protein n=1 Tax=Planotetraspora silvatica TaxID=234614 RepID=A0A8J3UV94_9ACTN|nr:hypothetical protein Psi02_65700 [Planotetraspora silvatica]